MVYLSKHSAVIGGTSLSFDRSRIRAGSASSLPASILKATSYYDMATINGQQIPNLVGDGFATLGTSVATETSDPTPYTDKRVYLDGVDDIVRLRAEDTPAGTGAGTGKYGFLVMFQSRLISSTVSSGTRGLFITSNSAYQGLSMYLSGGTQPVATVRGSSLFVNQGVTGAYLGGDPGVAGAVFNDGDVNGFSDQEGGFGTTGDWSSITPDISANPPSVGPISASSSSTPYGGHLYAVVVWNEYAPTEAEMIEASDYLLAQHPAPASTLGKDWIDTNAHTWFASQDITAAMTDWTDRLASNTLTMSNATPQDTGLKSITFDGVAEGISATLASGDYGFTELDFATDDFTMIAQFTEPAGDHGGTIQNFINLWDGASDNIGFRTNGDASASSATLGSVVNGDSGGFQYPLTRTGVTEGQRSIVALTISGGSAGGFMRLDDDVINVSSAIDVSSAGGFTPIQVRIAHNYYSVQKKDFELHDWIIAPGATMTQEEFEQVSEYLRTVR